MLLGLVSHNDLVQNAHKQLTQKKNDLLNLQKKKSAKNSEKSNEFAENYWIFR